MRKIADRTKPNNRRYVRFFVAALIMSCLIGAVGVVPAQAANRRQISLTLNQNIKGDTHIAQAAEFTYTLTPKTAFAPLPDGSASESYTFKAAGTGEVYIGKINFNAAGVYTYELRCDFGENRFNVDQRLYTIEVYVINDQEIVSIVYASREKKVSELSFEHTYNGNPAAGGSMGGGFTGGGAIGGVSIGGGSVAGSFSGGSSTGTADVGAESVETDDTEIGDTDGLDRLPETSPPTDTVVHTPNETREPTIGPKTGDSSNPALWITLIIISNLLLVLIAFAYYKSNVQKRGQEN